MSTPSADDPTYAPPAVSGTSGSRSGTVTATDTPSGTSSDTDVTTERFLQFLIPAAATVASTFGPQIGSAIGGLVGGSSGEKVGGQVGGSIGGLLGSLGGGFDLGGLFGRSILPMQQPAWLSEGVGVDLTTPLVQQCTLGCCAKIAPDLADMLKQLYPTMRSDGDSPAGVEVQAVERFWGQIASFVTGEVSKYLPDLIKTATGAAVGLISGRDTGQYTPILTGSEAHARWFMPVLSSVLTAVQQHLPDLLDIVSGESRSRSFGITWTDIATYGRLREDFVRVIDQQDVGDNNVVELVLELAPHLSWLKELRLFDDNGAEVTRLHVQDAKKSDTKRVDANQLLTNGSIEFVKAKMFGIPTGMYRLSTAGMEQLRGKRTRIRWMAD